MSGALERSLLPLDTVESRERPQVLVFRERSSASAVWAGDGLPERAHGAPVKKSLSVCLVPPMWIPAAVI